MKKHTITTIYGVIVSVILVVTGCSSDEPQTNAGAEKKSAENSGVKLDGDNILLITLDTTRADGIASYGYAQAVTPTIDALSKRGSQFDQAFSQVNLTLPSHSSILTGRYPRELGVLVNGRNALGDSHPTLASLFKERGYGTAAFVASFVLDGRFGLARGFDVYDDDMGEQDRKNVQPMEWQVSGDIIVDRALDWLNTAKDKPFFCWVHFYDAHDPHEIPKGFKGKASHPYSAEITFMDAQIKRITDWLSANKLNEQTLIVIVGDHGESFGEHGEIGHTNFLYNSNLHVPYIFVHPNAVPEGQFISEVVELVDVFPTILDLFGMDIPDSLSSRSLTPTFNGGELENRPSYAESQYVYSSFGWAEQRSLTTPRWKYISSTKPELYDRQADPGETKNLIKEQPEIANNLLEALKTIYNGLKPGEGDTVTYDAQTAKVMASLGYVSTEEESDDFLTPGLSDPKDMNDVMKKYQGVRKMLEEADSKDAKALVIPILYQLTNGSPNSTMFRFLLGNTLLDIGEPEKAIEQLDKVLKMDRTQVHAWISMGDAYLQLDNKAEALKYYETALDVNQSRIDTESETLAHARLGKIALEIGDVNKSLEHYKAALQAKPESPENQFNMGFLLIYVKQFDQAVPFLLEAIRLKPEYGEALSNLGTAYSQLGDLTAAEKAFRGAMELKGVGAQACFNYALILSQTGRRSEAIPYLHQAIQKDPNFDTPYYELVSYYFSTRQFPEAKKVLADAVIQFPNNTRFLSTQAKLLSQCQDESVRDGKKAIEYALQAMPLTGNNNPTVMANLASAYAEDGQFEKAIEVSDAAIRLAEASRNASLANLIRAQQEEYRAGRAYRNKQF